MFTFFEPSDERIKNFLAAQRDSSFSYPEVGASKNIIPSGYPVNHHCIQLGSGAEIYERAADAIRNWAMYQTGWTHLYPPKITIVVGEVVCVVVNHSLCWSLNPCRIIYVLEEKGAIERYGFAFGTLPGHSEAGEEKFTVEWRRDDDSVWFELLAFARPHHILARIGFPFVGFFQQKFGEDSKRAMLKEVKQSGEHGK